MAASVQQIERFQAVSNPGTPDEKKDQSLEARLLAEVAKYWQLTALSRPRRYYLWLISALLSKAIHYTHFNQITGTVTEWSQEKVAACMYTPVPLLMYAVENLAAQYTSSNPKIVPMPANEDSPAMQAVVRGLRDYADYLDFEFYRADPHQRQTEGKLIPLRGAYSFLEWDKTSGGRITLPQYEPQGATMCADCGAPSDAPAEDAGETGESPCPECGSNNVQQATVGLSNVGDVAGRTGCVKRNVIDPFQVEIYDRGRGVAESPYLFYDEVMFKTAALKCYSWLKAIGGNASLGNSSDGFLGLHYLLQLQTIVSNTGRLDQSQPDYLTAFGGAMMTAGYQGSFLNDMLCWRRRAWFDAEVYADWTVEKDTQLPGMDQPLPAGTRLGNVFPEGLLLHIMNGTQIVQCENQNKNKVWTYVGYRPPSEGLHGVGVNPLVSLVRGHDEATSYEMQALLMCALGIIVVDERVKGARNIPGSVATVPISARLQGESIQSLMGRLDMGGGQAIAAAEPIKQGFRANIADLSMANSPNASGLDREGMHTATGVKFQAGAVNTLTGPPMELYAASKAQVITNAVEMQRTYGIRPHAYGKFGDTITKLFDPMLLPEDIRFGVAEDSWRPTTLETQRDDVAAVGGIIAQLGPDADPALKDKVMEVFGLESTNDGYEDWAIRAAKRLEALKAAVPAATQEQQQVEAQLAALPPDQAAALQQAQQDGTAPPPPDPAQRLIEIAGVAPRPLDVEGHVHYTRFWLNIYNSDEFDTFPPILQDAIESLYGASQDGIGQAGAVKTDQMVASQKPAMEAQAAAEAATAQASQAGQGQQQADAATAQAEAQGRAQLQAKVADHISKEHLTAAEHERTIAMEKATHQREKELQAKEHKHAIELERIKAKNKPKPQGSSSKRR